jgi:hypothetical protein
MRMPGDGDSEVIGGGDVAVPGMAHLHGLGRHAYQAVMLDVVGRLQAHMGERRDAQDAQQAIEAGRPDEEDHHQQFHAPAAQGLVAPVPGGVAHTP